MGEPQCTATFPAPCCAGCLQAGRVGDAFLCGVVMHLDTKRACMRLSYVPPSVGLLSAHLRWRGHKSQGSHREGLSLELDMGGSKCCFSGGKTPKFWLLLSPFQSEIICQMSDIYTDAVLGTKYHPSLENACLVTHDRAQTTEDECLDLMVGL